MDPIPGRWHPYLHQTDEEVVRQAQEGDSTATEYLLYKYRNLVCQLVKPYFIVGAEKEDLIQVGMIGLWQSITDFDLTRQTPFPVFARVCIHRHVLSAVKTALRQQHIPLNQSVLFGSCSQEGFDFRHWIADERGNPEEQLLESERRLELEQEMQQRLSPLEWQVLQGYLAGKSYQEISEELHCSRKAVDNALMRIKKKMGSREY